MRVPQVIERQIEELLAEEEAAEAEDPCYRKKCTSNEHCCDGNVCVDTSNGGESQYHSNIVMHLTGVQ